MRTAVPYEVKPRQLRALVVLLALLPLVPSAFVIRFLIEELRTERSDARVRARETYQKFLTATRIPLARNAWHQIGTPAPGAASDPWKILALSETAKAVLSVGPRGNLALPPISAVGRAEAGAEGTRQAAAVDLARDVLETGLNRIPVTDAARMRWRFLLETPEPIFGLLVTAPAQNPVAPSVLLVATRRRLMEELTAYYQKLLNAKSVLRVIDENGESSLLLPRGGSGPPAGEKLAEMALPPPLPIWRIQLFTADDTVVDGIMHEQIISYVWMLGGMLALTGIIAALAGWTLSRRIAFNEISNDALAAVAHEMKTPLSSTRMLLETLMQGRYAGGPAQVAEYLGLMAGENERLDRLVSSFQMLGRLEHSHGRGSRLRLVPVEAAEIIEEACMQLAPRLQATGCEVQVEIPEPPPLACLADKEALTAALVNLLDNAAKYSEPGSRITVRVSDEADGVLFEVGDEGIGIAADEQDRIFERFYQSDRRLARTYGGCGLGLSIVQSVVRLHGGTISVRSAPGCGSTFSIRLPRVRGAWPAPAFTRRLPFPWMRNRRTAA